MATVDVHGIPGSRALRPRITGQLSKLLAQLHTEPTTARAAFFDDDGPRGGAAVRCALTVRLPHRPVVHVEHTASTPRRAFDGAFAALERGLVKQREIRVERRRRPKKYYAAKRLLSQGLSATESTQDG